jgi:transposase-like protein
LEALIERGMTIAEIAEEVQLSKGTVRYWLRRFGLRTENARGRRAGELARAGKEAGLLTVRMMCRTHGEAESYSKGVATTAASAAGASRSRGGAGR